MCLTACARIDVCGVLWPGDAEHDPKEADSDRRVRDLTEETLEDAHDVLVLAAVRAAVALVRRRRAAFSQRLVAVRAARRRGCLFGDSHSAAPFSGHVGAGGIVGT